MTEGTMKQYIAMRAMATSSVAIRTDSRTVQTGTNLMDLVDRVAGRAGSIIVVWTYIGSDGTMGLKDAVAWTEMVLPSFVYALVDGGQFVLLREHRHHVSN